MKGRFLELPSPQSPPRIAQISTAARGLNAHELVTLNVGNSAEIDGYILAYLSNETQQAIDVNFDDFTIYHAKTNVVSTQDYYPFGLTFNESVRVASTEQRFLYNQGAGEKTFRTERIKDLGLNWDMTKLRTYDYAVGRFMQVDPLADAAGQESLNPYHYVGNNPIMYGDPYGDCGWCKSAKAGLMRFVNMYRDGNKRAAHDNRNRPRPSVNRVTGNRMVDAAIHLAGGETVKQAANGNVQAQGRLIMGSIVALHPGARGMGDELVRNADNSSAKLFKQVSGAKPQIGEKFGNLGAKISDGNVNLSGRAKTNGTFDFVVDESGKLQVGTGHQALSGGNSVQAAGQIKIVDGQVKMVNNSSGHYQISMEDAAENFGQALQNAGVDISGAKLKLYDQDGVLQQTNVME